MEKKLNKFERVNLVKALSLNAPNNILITSHNDWEEQNQWLSQFENFTVRSFRAAPSESSDPCFPFISAKEFEKHRADLLDSGWNLIIAEGLDPSKLLFSGTVLREGDLTEVDLAMGPGVTPREVTHNGRIDKHFSLDGEDLSGDRLVDEVLAKIREVETARGERESLKNVIYEFSYYGPKVGHKKENVIFWEITGFKKLDDLGEDLISLVGG
jgi:hypothetical protein